MLQGLVSPEEFLNTNFPNQYRTVDEVEAPFRSTDPLLSTLRLVHCETATVPCPYAAGWRGGNYATARAFAEDFVPTTRTWSNSTFHAGLGPHRSDTEKTAVVDELFAQYIDTVAAQPEQHRMDYVHAYMVFEKL